MVDKNENVKCYFPAALVIINAGFKNAYLTYINMK